jgi:hypothetical protein
MRSINWLTWLWSDPVQVGHGREMIHELRADTLTFLVYALLERGWFADDEIEVIA